MRLSQSNKNKLAQLSGAVIVIILIAWSIQLISKDPLSDINPLELRLDLFETINPRLIAFEKEMIIDVNRDSLMGITVDGQNNIYVTAEKSVLKYNQKGELLFSFFTKETARCITASDDGLYIGFKNQLIRTDFNGMEKQELILLDQTSIITSLAVSDSRIYLADAGYRLVRVLTLDGSEINTLGEKQPDKGMMGFIIPSPYFDVALDYENLLWAVNPGMHLLQQFSRTGDPAGSWGITSSEIQGFCGCCNPVHFAFLPDGRYVTSEKGLVRVKVYDQTGKFESVVSGPENFSRGVTDLDIAVDKNGRILVLDPDAGKVLCFIASDKKTEI